MGLSALPGKNAMIGEIEPAIFCKAQKILKFPRGLPFPCLVSKRTPVRAAMNLQFAREQYRRHSQPEATVPDDAHAIIALVMEELHGALQRLCIASENQAALPTDAMVKSMSALYILQSSLDMDSDTNIAVPLFQVYEYCRQQVMAAFRKDAGHAEGLGKARDFIASLKDAWGQMDKTTFEPKSAATQATEPTV
jgi:flagellar secretion chaperone FliS